VRGAGQGRGERFALTEAGARRLADASGAVAAIEERMLSPLTASQRRRLHADLIACAEAVAVA